MLIPAQSAPVPPLSSLHSLSSRNFLLPAHFLPPGGVRAPLRRGDLAIRMGGGPRTFPGGVSKWQWKRMQAKKARQLLKARLARERQLYEMRKRAELRDAVAHLERPWDPDSAADASAVAPNLLSVAADDQLRALADRFHRPGGVDLWNDRDGPRVFASPATGAASARFFPKNAVHSIQPYALSSSDLLLPGRGDSRGQGVRENAAEEEVYSSTADGEPAAVELMERDGTWEPVDAFGDADDSTAGGWTLDDDDGSVVTSESEGTGNAGSWREGRAMVWRNGRINGMAMEHEAAGAMAAGRNGDRGWRGDAFSSDSERAREGHRERRLQERSSGAGPRQRAGGRWSGSKTAAGSTHGSQRGRTGAGSFSDSEVIRGDPEPKWRTRSRDDTRNGAGRRDAPRKEWIGDGFESDSDSAGGKGLEPRWGARNKLDVKGNSGGRAKPKHSANASDGRRPFRGGFAEDLEAPTWKPRRLNRARNNNGGRDDAMDRGFRRGDDGMAGRAWANTTNSRGDGSEDGGRRTARYSGRRNWGGEYSLRPTSELRSTWSDKGLDGL